jgi:hypothetical protein
MSRYSPPLAYWMWRQQQLGAPGAGGGTGSNGASATPPANAIQDRSGSYVLDRSGSNILTR